MAIKDTVFTLFLLLSGEPNVDLTDEIKTLKSGQPDSPIGLNMPVPGERQKQLIVWRDSEYTLTTVSKPLSGIGILPNLGDIQNGQLQTRWDEHSYHIAVQPNYAIGNPIGSALDIQLLGAELGAHLGASAYLWDSSQQLITSETMQTQHEALDTALSANDDQAVFKALPWQFWIAGYDIPNQTDTAFGAATYGAIPFIGNELKIAETDIIGPQQAIDALYAFVTYLVTNGARFNQNDTIETEAAKFLVRGSANSMASFIEFWVIE